MAHDYPPWLTEEYPDFDLIMSKASADVLNRLQSDRAYRAAALSDPRDLHKDLYALVTPQGYCEYAGTYRGTPNTTLWDRPSSSPSVIKSGTSFALMAPNDVPDAMARVLPALADLRTKATTPWDQLWAQANLFVQFGKIHPFLDGNGHVQRALFAASALEMGIPLSNRFAIHPRSYDFLLAYALECFTRALSDEVGSQWCMAVAEYVAQWLAGPFDAPGSGLPPL